MRLSFSFSRKKARREAGLFWQFFAGGFLVKKVPKCFQKTMNFWLIFGNFGLKKYSSHLFMFIAEMVVTRSVVDWADKAIVKFT